MKRQSLVGQFFLAAFLLCLLGASLWPAYAAPCPNSKKALGVSRVIEIDTSDGAIYGDFTKAKRGPDLLKPKEVILTFDDGPIPRITKPILDALDAYCTKATFFAVGKMAMAYPAMIKEIAARGHTLAGHTWTHPLNLRRVSLKRAKDQIERGFAAVSLAAGKPIAPFFRFPGLSDSGPLLSYLETRNVASFTVDVVSNDSYIGSSSRLTRRVLQHTKRRNGGILLFHDIKKVTARALPQILKGLKAGGYQVVHIRPKEPVSLQTRFDKANLKRMKKAAPKFRDWKPAKKPAPALQTAAGKEPPVSYVPDKPEPTDTTPSDEGSSSTGEKETPLGTAN